MKKIARGFTLIEIMIVVAIVAILTAIALPAYSDYVTRGKLVDAVNNLQSLRSALEQYYQDNRTYADTGTFSSPCTRAAALTSAVKTFNFSCTLPAASQYLLTATGKDGNTSGFTFQLDQTGTAYTSTLPARWGGSGAVPNPNTCFVTKKGATC